MAELPARVNPWHYLRTGRISSIRISGAFFFFPVSAFHLLSDNLAARDIREKKILSTVQFKILIFFTPVLIAIHFFPTLNYLKDVSCGFHLQAVESEICSSNAGKQCWLFLTLSCVFSVCRSKIPAVSRVFFLLNAIS